MPASVEISIVDRATPAIRDMAARLKSDDLKAIAGRAGAGVVRTWLRTLESSRPNALGGERTSFWGKAASATSWQPTADGAEVYTAATGVLYQRWGGTLLPSGRTSSVTGQAIVNLAIPARAEAHGRLPSDFDNLVPMIRWRDGKRRAVGLAEPASQDISFGPARKDGSRRVKRGAEHGAVLFWLVKSAQKGPDESVLPPPDLVGDAVTLALLRYVTHNARRLAS
jgi:hypothetical protein